MYGNGGSSSRDFGESSHFTNWVLYLEATCHMTPQVYDFIPGSLEDMDKYIEVKEIHYVTDNQNGQFQIKMCNDNRNHFIAILHNTLLEPNLCDGLFLIITLINSGHTCLFHKGFCTV